MKQKIDIIWIKRELRVVDNKLLSCTDSLDVLPIFIFDKDKLYNLNKNNKRISFLFQQLIKFKSLLRKNKLDIAIFYGSPLDIFDFLAHNFEINNIIASNEFDNYSKNIFKKISKKYKLKLLNENFITPVEKFFNSKGQPYQVFSSFMSAIKENLNILISEEYRIKSKIKLVNTDFSHIISVSNTVTKLPIDLGSINFETQSLKFEGAKKDPYELLKRFESLIDNYAISRDFPHLNSTSLLSPHLRYGTISIRSLFRWILNKKGNHNKFLDELIWREFFNYLLYHYPESEFENFKKNIKIHWENNENLFKKWQDGLTGYPIVDAGMRQLKEEGYIHNRVRMIVANFLTKNLHIDWRLGERYFSLELIDYDIPSNIGNWQWNASTGVDTKFRFFNPFIQSRKFDSDTIYIKKYVQELKNIDNEILHNERILKNHSFKNYPKPIVDFKKTILEFKQKLYKKI
ncbi:MAG: deoxyribodipyrimidine photo-lyase [Endomicrobiia bacterium]